MNDFEISLVKLLRVDRQIAILLAVATVTILCHLDSGRIAADLEMVSNSGAGRQHLLRVGVASRPEDKIQAHDDNAITQEENPVTFNILANDKPEHESDSPIDPASVDLEPGTPGRDAILKTVAGFFAVSAEGDLRFSPAEDFFGRSRIEYNVLDLDGKKSNNASINVTVTNINDAPVITGQTPDPLTTTSDQPITIDFSNLIVTDPDNAYPNGFTMSISGGAGYSVSGNTITPDQNFTGRISAPITVNDGSASSNNYNLQIEVAAADTDSAPVITGQMPDPLVINEEQSFALNLSQLIVNANGSSFPAGFNLQIGTGPNYTISGNSIQPVRDFNGALSVPVSVSDGTTTSNTFNLEINVTAVNDAPVISGQTPNPVTTGEGQPVTILISNLQITDPDNVPGDFSISVSEGSNYSVAGNTVTPDQNFSGSLSVPVTVSDGQAMSNIFNITIQVNNSNDTPVITGQVTLNVPEDNSITITPSQLQVTDADNTFPDDFTIQVGAGTNYAVSGTTVTPNANFSGMLSVPVFVNDGVANSNTWNLQITVDPVNDPPIIVSQQPLSTPENTSLTLDLSSFSVTDPDNVYPNGFSISVQAGVNYSFEGNAITPSTGFSGTLTVPVQVSDGISPSNVFNAQVSVVAVNDPPTITGQNPFAINEDTGFTPQLTDLIVTDSDNLYPGGFALTVLPGSGYSFIGNSVTPSLNFNGLLTVNVKVNDGMSDSAPFGFQVSVTPVNDAPQITSQQTLSTTEDTPITIDFSHLTVSDPDNTYPSGFTLSVFPGNNYSLAGNTITPASNYQGTLVVGTQVNDGSAGSNVFQLQITVTNLNDTPVITGQQIVSTAEDSPVAISLNDLTVFDPDNAYPAGFTLTIGAGTNYSVSGNTITPSQDFNGTLNVPVTVNDGNTTSNAFNFQIQVGDSNDPPVIVSQVPLSTNEEQPIVILLSHFNVTDPDNAYPNGFSLAVSSGADYTVDNVTVIPAANFNGTLTVPVRVNDGVNNSATFNAAIQVNPVNDPPSFNAISNQTVLENSSPGVVNITNITSGPGESGQSVSFSATSSNTSIVPNPTISYGTATTATLNYSLTPNASGTVTVTVTATDNGPSETPNQNTYSSTFRIDVVEVNAAPTLNAIADITINEDAAEQMISLAGISAGPGETQAISIEVTSDKPELFEILQPVYTSPQASGGLRLKSSANSYGVATVTVRVLDNGSNISPSVNSVSRSFRVTIQPVNDLPVFTSVPLVVAAVNEPYTYMVEFTDVESPSLAVSAVSKPSWASLVNVAAGKYRLGGIPPASAAGSTTLDLRILDNGAAVDQMFSLLVNNRPMANPTHIDVTEDVAFTFNSATFTSAYADIDHHDMKSLQISQLPSHGTLLLNSQQIKVSDTVALASIGQLVYASDKDFDGADAFYWKPFDGYHFSAQQAAVDIEIIGVNDPPLISLETDTLSYDVNGEPAFITTLLTIKDPDNDSLTHADVVFNSNYDPEFDQLTVQTESGIHGIFDFENGKIALTGRAPVAAYESVIKSIQYLHLNTLDPVLKMKSIAFTAYDETDASDSKERLIDLKYTFIDLEIPSGFTPNGDASNDTWVITRPGGVDKLSGAVVRVFNRRGIKVFEGRGFNVPWDGTVSGQSLPADTYFFTIDLNLRNKKTYKGTVTLLR